MATTESGVQSLSTVAEITSVFTNCPTSHFIEQTGLRSGCAREPVTWNTEVWFGGRYTLTYQVEVLPNYRKHEVRALKPGRFFLNEAAEITDEGRGARFDPSGQRDFSEADWKRIVAAKGDFSVIGVTFKTNSVLKDWDTYVGVSQENTWSVEGNVRVTQ